MIISKSDYALQHIQQNEAYYIVYYSVFELIQRFGSIALIVIHYYITGKTRYVSNIVSYFFSPGEYSLQCEGILPPTKYNNIEDVSWNAF